MAAEDYLPYDFMCNEDEQLFDTEKTCKYCGTRRLEWHLTDKGWRLFYENGNIHNCPKYERKNEK